MPTHRGGALARFAAEQLQAARDRDLYRTRRLVDGGHGVELVVDGQQCINFCSNDYLGLAGDPRVADAVRRAIGTTGVGSGAAALVSGFNREHAALEEEVADFLGRPRALLFSSGWAANLGVMRALLGREDTLIADELNHASLIDGGRLSGARYVRAAHADLAAFSTAVAAAPPAPSGEERLGRLVATDGVFSMDGDVAPLAGLSALCENADVPWLVDDAHGFGVLGRGGRGSIEHCRDSGEVVADPDVHVITLGKAAGVAGGVVAGSDELIDYLIQRARTWVFSTAPPPALAAAARRALAVVRDEPEHRQRLWSNISAFRAAAFDAGLDLAEPVGPAAPLTPIQPIVVGDSAAAMAYSQALRERGFWVAAIRPPTVPKGTARLRVTLSAAHTPAQIDSLVAALAESRPANEPATC